MPYAGNLNDFAEFQQELVGSWDNQNFPGTDKGGVAHPLSYNVMPLPQQVAQPGQPLPYPGYILKNFTFYETIRFNSGAAGVIAIPALAPNRGGNVNQNAHALFYDQQVSFAEGPDTGKVVHVENGAWLYLDRAPQLAGPYATPNLPPTSDMKPQQPDMTIAKQISVPHGNSVLALGSFDIAEGDVIFVGTPTILGNPVPYPFPPGLTTNRYTTQIDDLATKDYENPDVGLTHDPSAVLQQAVTLINPDAYMHWRVTTQPLPHGKGSVTNIPFEQRRAEVTDYWADYWLLRKDGKFKYLAYTQTILMELRIGPSYDERRYIFPHITCNTVTKMP